MVAAGSRTKHTNSILQKMWTTDGLSPTGGSVDLTVLLTPIWFMWLTTIYLQVELKKCGKLNPPRAAATAIPKNPGRTVEEQFPLCMFLLLLYILFLRAARRLHVCG